MKQRKRERERDRRMVIEKKMCKRRDRRRKQEAKIHMKSVILDQESHLLITPHNVTPLFLSYFKGIHASLSVSRCVFRRGLSLAPLLYLALTQQPCFFGFWLYNQFWRPCSQQLITALQMVNFFFFNRVHTIWKRRERTEKHNLFSLFLVSDQLSNPTKQMISPLNA